MRTKQSNYTATHTTIEGGETGKLANHARIGLLVGQPDSGDVELTRLWIDNVLGQDCEPLFLFLGRLCKDLEGFLWRAQLEPKLDV